MAKRNFKELWAEPPGPTVSVVADMIGSLDGFTTLKVARTDSGWTATIGDKVRHFYMENSVLAWLDGLLVGYRLRGGQ